ncbi:hypothetical protein KDA_67420 [Dictyobacter alpinus]|uniref:DUF4253 domain-containing protein n=1 Tax=Dictyobacter alpinus TaxID=2014873 RepID=A0A402BIN0_9CHLR|nr:DUF4253 domain-containing protein [Dictyobacter alpinus]GCE31258.1 hypothetical protein KDA_67420 [Dictyobacter alpinus]
MEIEEILQYASFEQSSLDIPGYQRGEENITYLLRTPASQLLAHWEILRNLVSNTGYWPVIGWDNFRIPPWQNDRVVTLLEETSRFDISAWLEQEWLQQEYYHKGRYHTIIDEGKSSDYVDYSDDHFSLSLHLGRFSFTNPSWAPIALVPTLNCWEVPAYLPVTMNEWDPSLAVQVAMLKYWNERWGAEVVSMVSGAMELRVLRPPTRWEEALDLAKEQYVFCPDLIDQRMRSIQALAKVLLNGQVWWFWWD